MHQQEILHEAEEHRLAYVGMTRARKLLYLTCHRYRQFNDDEGRKEVFPAGFLSRLSSSPHCVVKGEDDCSSSVAHVQDACGLPGAEQWLCSTVEHIPI